MVRFPGSLAGGLTKRLWISNMGHLKMVDCIICEGTGMNPYAVGDTCKCCKGTGSITEAEKRIVVRLVEDHAEEIKKRLEPLYEMADILIDRLQC